MTEGRKAWLECSGRREAAGSGSASLAIRFGKENPADCHVLRDIFRSSFRLEMKSGSGAEAGAHD
jgi:hypothetical protein